MFKYLRLDESKVQANVQPYVQPYDNDNLATVDYEVKPRKYVPPEITFPKTGGFGDIDKPTGREYINETVFSMTRLSKYDIVFGFDVKDHPLPTDLTAFYAEKNRLKELPERLGNTQIAILDATQNSIEYMPPLPLTVSEIKMGCNLLRLDSHNDSFRNVTRMINLRILSLNNNRLMRVPGQLYVESLTKIDISNNFLLEFPDWYPPNLTHFNVSNNRLRTVPENIPVSVVDYDISKNNIDRVPETVIGCADLNSINYENNPSIRVSEEVLAFINDMMERRRIQEELQNFQPQPGGGGGPIIKRRTVYDDSQSVHSVEISKSIKANIQSLLDNYHKDNSHWFNKHPSPEKRLAKSLKEFEQLTNETARVGMEEICNRLGKHSELDLSIADVFVIVWNRVMKFETEIKQEVARLIVQEIPEMNIVCFVGRISRLVNALSGFAPEIQIEVSISTQLQAKYDLVSAWLNKNGIYEEDPIYQICYKIRFRTLLDELQLGDTTTQEWLSAFDIQPLPEHEQEILLARIQNLVTMDEYALVQEEYALLKHKTS